MLPTALNLPLEASRLLACRPDLDIGLELFAARRCLPCLCFAMYVGEFRGFTIASAIAAFLLYTRGLRENEGVGALPVGQMSTALRPSLRKGKRGFEKIHGFREDRKLCSIAR